MVVQGAHRHLEHRANLAREHGDTTPYGDSPLATSSFRVYHVRRMSNAIVVPDSRAIERYLGLRSPRGRWALALTYISAGLGSNRSPGPTGRQ